MCHLRRSLNRLDKIQCPVVSAPPKDAVACATADASECDKESGVELEAWRPGDEEVGLLAAQVAHVAWETP